MQYIVLDMEWNQPWPGSYAAQKVLPVQIHGEIIQIGAVRLLETGKIADEFQVLVRPKYYKKLNSRVSKLTGLRDARLREEGLSFPEALERFRDWIGGPCIFLTWGFDDITVLEDNILLHDGEPDWITQWYNAQMIFNAQTGCGNTQKALSTAMELLGIEPSRPAHDALGDAYHTAIICSRLDLPRGIAEYKQALQSHADGFHGDPPAGCISRSVFHGYATREAAIEAMTSRENHCPKCGKSMRNGRWISQQGPAIWRWPSARSTGAIWSASASAMSPAARSAPAVLSMRATARPRRNMSRWQRVRPPHAAAGADAPPAAPLPKAESRKRNNKSLSKKYF